MPEDLKDDDPTKDLTEDLTKNLTDSEKLNAILLRLTRVEAYMEDRARDTNPMLERIYKEVADLNQSVGRIERDIQLLREDLHNERHERLILGQRVMALESRPR